MLTGRIYWTCGVSWFGGDGTFTVSVKRVNITTAEKSCFFHHKIFFSLFKLAQLKKRWSLESSTSITPTPDFWRHEAGALALLCVWQHCLDKILITGKQPKWHQFSTVNLWNADTCRQRASCHSRTGICPPSVPPNLIPISHAQKPAQAGTESSYDAKHEDQELSLHRETAPWVSCSLKASGARPGPRNFPLYRGNDIVFGISAKTVGINCANKTNLW